MVENLSVKLEALRSKIEAQTRQRYIEDGFNVDLHFKAAIETRIVPGRKYTKIDVGSSGKFMVENDTGFIFGIKAYGVIHRGHRYGSLDTTDLYQWGRYSPVRIQSQAATLPQTLEVL